MMAEKLVSARWEGPGFKDDPYHAACLPVDPISESLRVGRHTDLEKLLKLLRDCSTGITMVGGPAGVGRTSLVNVAQQVLYEAGERFPLFAPVEAPAEASREFFLLTALSAVVSSMRMAFGETGLAPDERYRVARDAVTQAIEAMAAATFLISFASQDSGTQISGRKLLIPQIPLGVTSPTLIALLRGLTSLVQERGFKGIILPVKNPDVLDSEQFIRFFNNLRDACCAVQGAHWIFIADAGAFSHLESEARRVSETFTSHPIVLEPLAWSEVAEALERRRATFAATAQAVLPISANVVKLVYDAAGGELRFMFARLSHITLEFSARFPSEMRIPDELALALLSEWGQDQLARHRLAAREREVLEYVRKHGVIRARDHAALRIQRSQQLSQLLRGLQEKQYLRVEEKGTAREYHLSRAASLAFLSTHSRGPVI